MTEAKIEYRVNGAQAALKGLPGFIKIGGLQWQLVEDNRLMEVQGLLGETKNKTCTLTIDPEQNIGQLAETLLHEILHAGGQRCPRQGQWPVGVTNHGSIPRAITGLAR